MARPRDIGHRIIKDQSRELPARGPPSTRFEGTTKRSKGIPSLGDTRGTRSTDQTGNGEGHVGIAARNTFVIEGGVTDGGDVDILDHCVNALFDGS